VEVIVGVTGFVAVGELKTADEELAWVEIAVEAGDAGPLQAEKMIKRNVTEAIRLIPRRGFFITSFSYKGRLISILPLKRWG
jgi:hypothetical protein